MNKVNCNNKYKIYLSKLPWSSAPIMAANIVLPTRDRTSDKISLEEMVTILGTLALADTNIKFVTREVMNILLKAQELGNPPTDVAWLRKQVVHNKFNVYAVAYNKATDENDKTKIKPTCFGCIQCFDCLQDITDGVQDASREAMESKFWSIGFVLDGTMFSVPKYKNMVNGNPDSEFKRNGWHGMYVLSSNESVDRIYGVDTDFNLIREHTLKAYEAWHKDRMGFGISWRADK